MRVNTSFSNLSTPIFLTITLRNFKFNLRWDFDDPILYTYYCNINDETSSVAVMSALKSRRVDVLSLFAELGTFFYYDPSSIWRLDYNFKEAL